MKHLTKALETGASRHAQQPDTSWKKNGQEPATTGLRNWLLQGTGYSTVTQKASGEIVVECVDDVWAKANASDLIANREAAKESLLPRHNAKYSNKSLAWPVITSYYTAYFSAQSFLRCLGLGTIYLETAEASLLSAAWKARGMATTIPGSNYSFRVELSNPVVIVLRGSGGGGTHRQFWNGFQQIQQAIHTALLVSPALNTLSQTERQIADSEYTKLMEMFFINHSSPSKRLKFDWLSELRNDINYRFGKNVWLMNWAHSSALSTNHEGLIDRYSGNLKSLPEGQRNFSKNHLAFVATRLCQLVDDATSDLQIP